MDIKNKLLAYGKKSIALAALTDLLKVEMADTKSFNGGGKTVLVQLMMQPVHPKAMAGGRRIEDYFSHTGDHSYILLEWNLDGSKDKLLTGISIAASSSASREEDKRGNSVKYYTFTTRYEKYSAYSISSLDLSNNEDGNYVPARFDYVRERAKSSSSRLLSKS